MKEIRTYQFKYGIVHFSRAEAAERGDSSIVDEFHLHGPLLDAWDDEMDEEEFNALEDAHEQ